MYFFDAWCPFIVLYEKMTPSFKKTSLSMKGFVSVGMDLGASLLHSPKNIFAWKLFACVTLIMVMVRTSNFTTLKNLDGAKIMRQSHHSRMYNRFISITSRRNDGALLDSVFRKSGAPFDYKFTLIACNQKRAAFVSQYTGSQNYAGQSLSQSASRAQLWKGGL